MTVVGLVFVLAVQALLAVAWWRGRKRPAA
jgi:hypothetical protein